MVGPAWSISRYPCSRPPALLQSLGNQLDLSRWCRGQDIVEQGQGSALRAVHPQCLPKRDLTWPDPTHPLIGAVNRFIHQFLVGRLEAVIVKPEAGGEPAEDFSVRERFAEWRNGGFGPLQPMVTIGGIEIVAFEMRGRRQHDIAMPHGLGHGDLDAHTE